MARVTGMGTGLTQMILAALPASEKRSVPWVAPGTSTWCHSPPDGLGQTTLSANGISSVAKEYGASHSSPQPIEKRKRTQSNDGDVDSADPDGNTKPPRKREKQASPSCSADAADSPCTVVATPAAEDGNYGYIPITSPEEAYAALRVWLESNKSQVTALRRRNPVPVFDDHVIFYEEEHYYEIKGMRFRGSGTGIMHSVFEHFDEKVTIDRILAGKRWANDRQYKYYQMPGQAIVDLWETIRVDASERGTAMHAYIEYYYNFLTPEHLPLGMLGPEYGYFHQFHAQYIEGKLEPFRTELILWDGDYEAVGTIDMLYRKANRPADGSQDHILIMYDWKRSKKLDYHAFNDGDFGKGPCHTLQNCNVHHYYVQLNLYKYLIEKNTQYRIEEMYLGVFHPNHGEAVVVPVPFHQAEVKALCELRRYNLMRSDRAFISQTLESLPKAPLGEVPHLIAELQKRWGYLNRLMQAPESDPMVRLGLRSAPFGDVSEIGIVDPNPQHPWSEDE